MTQNINLQLLQTTNQHSMVPALQKTKGAADETKLSQFFLDGGVS